jgi:glucan 1,3-beta-glucosidase
VFFNNNNGCGTTPCQENGIDISDSHSTYLYGTNVFNIANMIRSDGKAIAKQAENVGGFAGAGGVVAAYLFNSL